MLHCFYDEGTTTWVASIVFLEGFVLPGVFLGKRCACRSGVLIPYAMAEEAKDKRNTVHVTIQERNWSKLRRRASHWPTVRCKYGSTVLMPAFFPFSAAPSPDSPYIVRYRRSKVTLPYISFMCVSYIILLR